MGHQLLDKMRRFKGECEHFSFNKSPIYTHDCASAKFSTNSQEMDNSVMAFGRQKFPLLINGGRSGRHHLNRELRAGFCKFSLNRRK
jgi:hypothetical protein